ncbi:MAG: 50S ribosomal protein L29 [Myxococcota bacterium]
MKPQDIREQTTEELTIMEGDLRRQLWKARFDNHTSQLDDTSSIPKLRRDLARVKTILTERRAAEAASGSEQE